jgi:hypothetical protein
VDDKKKGTTMKTTNLDLLIEKKLFHNFAVVLVQASVVETNAKRQRELEIAVADRFDKRHDLFFGRMQKLLRVILRTNGKTKVLKFFGQC